MLRSSNATPNVDSQRTANPIVTGGSVVGVKYNGGILVAADTLASYGSLARFKGVVRIAQIGDAGDTLLAAGGEYSDYQYMLKLIEGMAVEEFAMDDGATMSPKELHHWLTRVMYNRRSKMDPLWNRCERARFALRTESSGSSGATAYRNVESPSLGLRLLWVQPRRRAPWDMRPVSSSGALCAPELGTVSEGRRASRACPFLHHL